jgi:hypothetical protein
MGSTDMLLARNTIPNRIHTVTSCAALHPGAAEMRHYAVGISNIQLAG